MLLFHRVIAGGVAFSGLLALDLLAAHQLGDDSVDLVILVGGFFAWTRNNQRSAGFVHQDRIYFVHDREVVAALGTILQAEFHVVAQIVEAVLVVGAVSDIGGVIGATLLVVQIVHKNSVRQPQEPVDAAHPFGVALGQIIVDRDDVDALAFERIQVAGQRGNQRFAFARPHFGDAAPVQKNATD